jgi:hypothetical protein
MRVDDLLQISLLADGVDDSEHLHDVGLLVLAQGDRV